MLPSYLIFARFPEIHTVKTRLASLLGAENTLHLYGAMLYDTISRLLLRNLPLVVCVEPSHRIEDFRHWLCTNNLLSPQVRLIPQTGDTLGDKMYAAFVYAQKNDLLPALITGTDIPTAPIQVFEEAERLMQKHPDAAIIGATRDGGFYIMGLPKVCLECFFGNDYSNTTVFERTLFALKTYFKEVFVLPAWYDVDDATGLRLLQDELSGTHCPASRTQKVLQSFHVQ